MNRAQRRSRRQAVTNKRIKELKQMSRTRYDYLSSVDGLNRFSKMSPFDCGYSCPLCNPDKFGSRDNKGYKTTDSNTYKGDITDETQ